MIIVDIQDRLLSQSWDIECVSVYIQFLLSPSLLYTKRDIALLNDHLMRRFYDVGMPWRFCGVRVVYQRFHGNHSIVESKKYRIKENFRSRRKT